jgi:hypothetical protein
LNLPRDLPTAPADVAAQRGLREARLAVGLDEDRLRALHPPRLFAAPVPPRSTASGRPPFELDLAAATVEPRLRPVAPHDRDFLLRLYASTREPFSLVFAGPAAPVLPQSIYRLENDDLGALEIFLVPIGRDAGGTRYEAAFN